MRGCVTTGPAAAIHSPHPHPPILTGMVFRTVRTSVRMSPDPAWFPIGVWGSYNFTPENVRVDRDAGLNTYIWDAGQAAWEQQNIAASGMRSIRNNSDRSGLGPHVAGWL